MTYITLNEPVVTALATRLEDDLTATIDEINADVNDGYYIDYPVAVLDYPPPLSEIINTPLVCIQDGSSRFEDDLGYSATGVHTLSVITFIADADPRALAWKLRRYEQAIITVALADRNLGVENAWGTVLERVDPGPTLGRGDPREWLSWVAISMTAKAEDIP